MSHVKAVSMDMNTNYSVAFVERYPQVDVVWDPFHVHQWFNKGLDSARRTESNRLKREADKKREAGDDEAADELMAERKLLFGQRFNLLANTRTLKAKDALNAELNREAKEQAKRDGRNPNEVGRRRTDNLERLQTLLDTNDKLNAMLRAREELQDALALEDPSEMRSRLEEWVATWSKAGISQLTRFTKTIAKRMDGIVARAEHHISSGIIEGTNTLVLCPAFYYPQPFALPRVAPVGTPGGDSRLGITRLVTSGRRGVPSCPRPPARSAPRAPRCGIRRTSPRASAPSTGRRRPWWSPAWRGRGSSTPSRARRPAGRGLSRDCDETNLKF
jgi:hypothetical protein